MLTFVYKMPERCSVEHRNLKSTSDWPWKESKMHARKEEQSLEQKMIKFKTQLS